MYPAVRMRRLRKTPMLRGMVQETRLSPWDFIYPLFIVSGKNFKREVPSLPGVYQQSVDMLKYEVDELKTLGIPAVLLFGLPKEKDSNGLCSLDEDGPVQNAIRFLKKEYPELIVITDVCLCEYTSHGHCGILDESGYVNNDLTIELLATQAVSHAKAGADMVAPSDMMDGRVGAIRKALDASGFYNIPIMSYAAKFASSFYGPFRDVADSAPKFGDRKSYQMNGANGLEALREVELDIKEGADIVMVKPALPYLDVLAKVKETFMLPTCAYHVSGSYAMVKVAALNGLIDEKGVMMESLTSIKRAGADMIITYYAKEAAKILREETGEKINGAN